jgi:hypothetical protein
MMMCGLCLIRFYVQGVEGVRGVHLSAATVLVKTCFYFILLSRTMAQERKAPSEAEGYYILLFFWERHASQVDLPIFGKAVEAES